MFFCLFEGCVCVCALGSGWEIHFFPQNYSYYSCVMDRPQKYLQPNFEVSMAAHTPHGLCDPIVGVWQPAHIYHHLQCLAVMRRQFLAIFAGFQHLCSVSGKKNAH